MLASLPQRGPALGDQLRGWAGLTHSTDKLIIKMILGRRFLTSDPRGLTLTER